MDSNENYLYRDCYVPIQKRMSNVSIASSSRATSSHHSEYGIKSPQKYDSYQEFLQRNQLRRRLSSTGENSGDSSTTASGSSCYGGEQEGSEGRIENDEISDTTTNDDNNNTGKQLSETLITDIERQKVETFFKGLKTQVFVSNSLANLYIRFSTDNEWQLKYTGIPVVILDCGESRARNKRKIQITLAERGTSFMLWSDIIDNLSSYKVESESFHTMLYSRDHTMFVGFSFDTKSAAEEMWKYIEQLIACPENISLSLPGKKKKKKEKKEKPLPLPTKNHISQPCCFQHLISVDKEDTERYYTLKEMLPAPRSAVDIRQIHNLDS